MRVIMGKGKAEHDLSTQEGLSNIEVSWSEVPVNSVPATTLSGPTVQVTQQGIPVIHVTTKLATSAISPSHVEFTGVPSGQETLGAVSTGEVDSSGSEFFWKLLQTAGYELW